MTTADSSHTTVVAREGGHAPYQTPRLSMFGDVGSLTETESVAGMEDNMTNGTCGMGQNTTFNMC